MPVIMVMFGAWKPPGSEKVVRRGGKYTVSDELAASLVKCNKDKYKILEVHSGKSIPTRKAKQGDVLRERGSVDFSGRGSDVHPSVGIGGGDDHGGNV